MRAGIIILPDQSAVELARRFTLAESYGFHSAWTYDHLGWRDLVDGPWFDAVTTLAIAATATSRIRLGTLVASPNFRHPVAFARSVTALDDLSGGRVTLGIGAGGAGFDEAVLGLPALTDGDRVDRFAEFVELLDLLLTTSAGGVTWEGAYFSAVDARATPGCVQTPRVPFVVAANGPRSQGLAARFGQGWVTGGTGADTLDGWWRQVGALNERFTELLLAAGRDPASVERHLSLDAAPVFSLRSVADFTDAIGRATELGFTDVHTHWPRASSWYAGDEAVLEAVAADVLPAL